MHFGTARFSGNGTNVVWRGLLYAGTLPFRHVKRDIALPRAARSKDAEEARQLHWFNGARKHQKSGAAGDLVSFM